MSKKNQVMIVWILFMFYIFILVFRLVPYSFITKPSFPKIFNVSNTYYNDCASDNDCKSSEICFQNKCTLKLKSGSCNPVTGNWVPTKINDKTFVKCVCKYPELVDQNVEGGNCIVSLACQPNGMFIYNNKDPKQFGKCLCDKGYVENVQFQCNKELPYNQDKYTCLSDEMTRIEARTIFEKDYLDNINKRVNCIKNPCSFNIFNGKPLRHTTFDNGCQCDPRYGNFGVKFEKGKYLKTDGYDACANIFEDEPNYEIDVVLYNYFYIRNYDPITFIHFDVQDSDQVVPQLRPHVKNFSIQISEDWDKSYTQYALKYEPFFVHTRECVYWDRVLYIEHCNEYLLKDNQMEICQNIPNHLDSNVNTHMNAYTLLYKYPICYFHKDSNYDPRYFEKFVLNPFFLTLKKHPNLLRTNGFKLIPRYNKWFVELAESEFEKYESTSKAPNLDNGRLAKYNLK